MKQWVLAVVAIAALILGSAAAWAQPRGGGAGAGKGAPGGGGGLQGGGVPRGSYGGAPRGGGGPRGEYRGPSHGGGRYHSWGYRGWYGPRVGVYFGGPLWWGGWPYYGYPYPYFYGYPYPYPTYVDPEPPIYVERAPEAQSRLPAGYWYYCPDPAGYYPYVQTCKQEWMQVVPQAPDVPPDAAAPSQ